MTGNLLSGAFSSLEGLGVGLGLAVRVQEQTQMNAVTTMLLIASLHAVLDARFKRLFPK
jgi:hypothetical protein